MSLYSVTVCEDLMYWYIERGGESVTIEEGVLGLGLVVCFGEGLKTAVIKEIPVNEWSSGHRVRLYNKMPEKYRAMLEKAGVL